MGKPKSDARLEAERLCRELPDAPSRTLARRLAKEMNITVECARHRIRTARGNFGTKNRKYATSPKANGTPGYRTEMPPSLAEPWLPFELDAKRVAILSDIHVPYHDKTALEAAVKWSKGSEPDAVLLNGDVADFYSVSRYMRNPKKRKFSAEIEMTQWMLEWMRGQFPNSRLIYKLGNHDERWDHWLWNNAPEISDLPQLRLDAMLEFGRYGIELVTDQRPVFCGLLPVFHGHELPKGISSPVNPARGVYTKMADTALVGHHHKTSGHAESNWKKDEMFCWSTGCLCAMWPEHARINKWNHGFAFVEVASDGQFNVENLRIVDGVVRKS